MTTHPRHYRLQAHSRSDSSKGIDRSIRARENVGLGVRPAPGTGPDAVDGRRQRVSSAARIDARRTTRGVELERLDQQGGAKIRLPRSDASTLQAVLVNTAGGLTGGDVIDWHSEAGDGAHLSVSTAASEKVYRSNGPVAHQSSRLVVGRGARLDWLPQETIFYDGGRLSRRLEVDIADDATLLMVEAIVFGRHAMGERVRTGTLNDHWRIRRAGRLLHAEALAFDAAWDLTKGSEAGYGADLEIGAQVTALYVPPAGDASLEHRLTQVRRALDALPVVHMRRFAASLLPGRLILRGVARDGHALRSALIPALAALDDERALPRVWHV